MIVTSSQPIPASHRSGTTTNEVPPVNLTFFHKIHRGAGGEGTGTYNSYGKNARYVSSESSVQLPSGHYSLFPAHELLFAYESHSSRPGGWARGAHFRRCSRSRSHTNRSPGSD